MKTPAFMYQTPHSGNTIRNHIRRLKSDLAALCDRANACKNRGELVDLIRRGDAIRSELVDRGEFPETSR